MSTIKRVINPHTPTTSWLGIIKRTVSYLVTLSLIFSPLSAYPSALITDSDQEYEQAKSRLDEFMRLTSQLRSHIDRSQFELGALLEKLNFDADEIIRFLKEDIAFEQYPGLLRGAQGTLMSRAGNTLDQAVLLASLLNDAAYESRILKGELNTSQIKQLLKQMQGDTKSSQSSGDLDKYKGILERMARLVNMPENNINIFIENTLEEISVRNTPEYKDAIADKEFIIDQLKKAGEKLEPLDITEELTKEAREYFWVEYRVGQSDKWKAVHPAFHSNPAEIENLAIKEVLKDKIPEVLQHRFRIQVFLEQKTGDNLETRELIGPWEKPSANLLGKSISFSNVPDGFKSFDDANRPEEVATNTKFLNPVFKVDGNPAMQADYFDMSGIVVDREAAGSQGAELFQTLGKKIEHAVQNTAKPGAPRDDNFRALSAQWIQFTQILPGGSEKKTTRYVIDRIGAENREKGITEIVNYKKSKEAIWKLATTHKFNISTGTYPESYIFDRYLSRMISARPLFESAIEESFFPTKSPAININDIEKIQDSPELFVADSFNHIGQVENEILNYHHEPALVILKNEFSYSDSIFKAKMVVDIVNNKLRVLKPDGDRILYAPDKNILLGTWATRLEDINKTAADSTHSTSWNTRIAFKQAENNQVPILLMTPDDTSQVIKNNSIPAEARQAILRDMSNGYSVLIPERVTDKYERVGWWRINTHTGETLGMINEGLGSAITEKVLLFIIPLGISALLAIPAFQDCRNKPQGSGKMCSLKGCLQGAGIGILIGSAIGYSVGLIAAALAAPGAIAVGAVGAFKYSHEAPEAIKIAIEIGTARGVDIANAVGALPQLPNCIE